MNLKRWIAGAAAVLVLAGVGYGMTWWAASREVTSGLETLNAGGPRGRALLVYHPGLSEFPKQVTRSFADGLVQAGWKVDVTTASRQTPADVSAYDLVVLGTPVYMEAPAAPLSDYVARVGDFRSKPVALVFTAAAETIPALDVATAQVTALHGRVIGRFGYTTSRPNESSKAYPGTNQERAAAMARDAARSLLSGPSPG